ncbi:TCP-1/cpn60 chaperonin family protein [Gloeobacter violaceus]|uniref:Glr3748 protein n=1 Tax=Gloeobacter violaceus (strain ATCC 29082 / PCC 7421) TaxID=251221 RepID=Q7NEX9_GLOVI|nr:TCP-1/cpn60 chaperonin family protein [Gloeobacter violaceus]BAC91689.1 glr3748 [Gloeobacter violaceus PCC 7421]
MTAEGHLKVLRTNIAAVRAIVETVAGTLGPKGLDVLLVDDAGRMTLTNDGVEILGQLDAQHPAARLVIQVAEAQDRSVGDGTTTATVLAGALLDACLERVEQGIAINALIAGLRAGVQAALDALRSAAVPVTDLADPRVPAVTRIAARGDEAIARIVWEAANHIGFERLRAGRVRLGELVSSRVGESHRWIEGLVLAKQPLQLPPEGFSRTGGVLVLSDPFESESFDAQVLATEGGFARYLEAQEQLRRRVQVLVEAGVVLLVCEKSISPTAEPLLAEAGIVALQRILRRDSERTAGFSGAVPVRQGQLARGATALAPVLGKATVRYERPSQKLVLSAGGGEPLAAMIVGAVSAEVAAELERVAVDACSALQAALTSGVVTGGGVAELASRRAVSALAARTEGVVRYGIEAVAAALRRPLEQIVSNSGYSALEKVAQLEAMHQRTANPHLGIDCENGEVVDLWQAGVIDPLAVKTCALEAAAEIAERILRIQTVVRRRETPPGGA